MPEIQRINGTVGQQIRPIAEATFGAAQGENPSVSTVVRGLKVTASMYTPDGVQVLGIAGMDKNLRHYMTDNDRLRVTVETESGEKRQYNIRRSDLNKDGEAYIVTDQKYRLLSIEHSVGGFLDDPYAGHLG